MRVLIPKRLRDMQKPWIKEGAYGKAERLVRFGGRVSPHPLKEDCLMVTEYLSGGGGTCMWTPAEEQTVSGFLDICDTKVMNLSQMGSPRRLDPLREKLRVFLEGRGVTLQEESKSRNPETYKIIIEILNLLPEHHFGHEHFTTLRLGDWGGGAAKCSEYADPVVHIFDFALKGPKRNLIALLLHEIGHSFMKLLSPQQLDSMKRIRKLISEMPPEAILGVDYLIGEDERKYHGLSSVREFTAETYLLYVTQGAFTRDGLSSRRAADLLDYGPDNLPETSRFMGFLDSLDPAHRVAWLELWKLYREGFGGIEYI